MEIDCVGVPVAGPLATSVGGSTFSIPQFNSLAATSGILAPLAKGTDRHSPLVPRQAAAVSSSMDTNGKVLASVVTRAVALVFEKSRLHPTFQDEDADGSQLYYP
jgi:hypothetical protein